MKRLLIFTLLGISMLATPLHADECMEGNCEDGVGSGFTEEGYVYNGQWFHGMPHGKGTISLPKKEKFIGEFKKGKFHGAGVYIKKDGSKIKGRWRDGKLVVEDDQEE